MVTVSGDWVKGPSGIVKLVALIISCVALGLQLEYYYGVYSRDVIRMTLVIVPSTCLVLSYSVFSYIFDQNGPGKNFLTEIVFDVVHAVLNIIIGAYVFDTSSNSDGFKAFGASTIILAVVLFIDAFFTFKSRT